jgi:hypothetical protein
VNHDYEFAGRGPRWRMLERNRWATIVRTYPGPLLALVLPALLAAELAIVAAAFASGWGLQKLGAWADVLRWLPSLLRQRREVQAARSVSSAELARHMTADLSSDYLGAAARNAAVRAALRGYWRVVCLLLRAA